MAAATSYAWSLVVAKVLAMITAAYALWQHLGSLPWLEVGASIAAALVVLTVADLWLTRRKSRDWAARHPKVWSDDRQQWK